MQPRLSSSVKISISLTRRFVVKVSPVGHRSFLRQTLLNFAKTL